MRIRKFILTSCIIILTGLFIEGALTLPQVSSRGSKKIDYKYQRIPGTAPKATSEQKYKEPEFNMLSTSYKPVNVLVLGLDEYEERSDVIMLLNIDPNSSRLNILSIARDTRVRAKGRYTKINALVGMGGEKLITSKVEELTGLPVTYYITLNFKGFEMLIDTLGGVEMNIPIDMDYDDPEQNLHIHLKKGRQLLDGQKAEQFVRYRKGNSPGTGYTSGDLDRIRAQQELIKALVEQKIKFRYLSKVDDIFHILKTYMKTNIEMRDVDYYLAGIRNIKYEKIEAFTLPGDSAYTRRVWYYIHDKKKTGEMIEKYFFK